MKSFTFASSSKKNYYIVEDRDDVIGIFDNFIEAKNFAIKRHNKLRYSGLSLFQSICFLGKFDKHNFDIEFSHTTYENVNKKKVGLKTVNQNNH